MIYLNRNLAEYFLGTWSGTTAYKPISFERIDAQPDQGNGTDRLTFDKPIIRTIDLNIDRLSPCQPIKYSDFHTNIQPRFNLRKLSVLPFHLLRANMIEGIEILME